MLNVLQQILVPEKSLIARYNKEIPLKILSEGMPARNQQQRPKTLCYTHSPIERDMQNPICQRNPILDQLKDNQRKKLIHGN